MKKGIVVILRRENVNRWGNSLDDHCLSAVGALVLGCDLFVRGWHFHVAIAKFSKIIAFLPSHLLQLALEAILIIYRGEGVS